MMCTRRTVRCVLVALGLVVCSRQADAAIELSGSLGVTVTGSSVTYTFQVCNQGKESPATTAGLYYDQSAAPGCSSTPDHTWSVPGLKSGVCQTLTHTRTAVPVGTFKAWGMADQGCSVSEPSESNNVSSSSYAVMPDLSVTDVVVTVSGSDVTYEVTVTNSGLDVPQSFDVGLYFDRSSSPTCSTTPDVTFNIPGLAVNATVVRSHLRSGAPDGAFRAYALVDQGCVANDGKQYIALSNQTQGIKFHICTANWTPLFNQLGQNVATATTLFKLTKTPKAGSVQVTIDGKPAQNGVDYQYDANINQVKLLGQPKDGSKVQVCYEA